MTDELQAAPTEDGDKEVDVTAESPSSKRKDAPTTTTTSSRTKRERKSVERLEDAYVGKKEKELAVGRGIPLATMETVAANIKAAKMKGTELATAHNLCFGGRGKDRLKKTQLLEFSGYLPVKEGSDAAKQKEIEEKLGVSDCILSFPCSVSMPCRVLLLHNSIESIAHNNLFLLPSHALRRSMKPKLIR